MKNRLLSLLLTAAILCSLTACSDTGDITDDTAPSGSDAAQAGSETEASAETEEDYAEYMPTATYNGAEFTIMNSTDQTWCLEQVDADEMSGETFNDSIYERNTYIEDTMDVKISAYESGDVGGDIKTAVAAGDSTYSIAYPGISTAASLALNDNLLNLAAMEGLRLDMPWWDQASIDTLTFNGKTYFAENEINIQYNEATWVLYFNKMLVTQYNLTTPYTLVRENEWTMDKMHELMGQVAGDANGDGQLTAPDDYFGFSTHTSSYMGMLAGSGESLVVPDGEGSYVSNMTNEKMVDIAVKIGSIINDEQATVIPDRFPGAGTNDNEWATNTFYNGHSLFYGEVIGKFAELREMEHDFGLIPFPKYETSQEYYTCQVLSSALCYTVPTSVQDQKMVADVTEALAIESLKKLRPAYFDTTITGKSMRDAESLEMLEIIIQYRIYDIGDIFGWGGVSGTFTSAVDAGGENYMSAVKKNEKALKKAISNTMEFFYETEE